jgi:hypothetical protein
MGSVIENYKSEQRETIETNTKRRAGMDWTSSYHYSLHVIEDNVHLGLAPQA